MSIDPDGLRITFGGLASGLDTNALVDALMQVERIPLLRLESRRSEIETQQRRFRDLNNLLDTLRSSARAIDNQTPELAGPALDEELLAYQASSSDESILYATADGQGTATPGSFDVRVDQLATVARRVSTGYGSAQDSVGQSGDTLSIDYGGAQTIDLTLSGAETLQSLRDSINGDANNDGSVRAELLDDGNGSVRLIINGTEVGSSNDVTVTTSILGPGGQPFIDAALSQSADDANLTVFGVPISRSTNDVDDAIPGVTLHLRGTHDPAAPSQRVEITLNRDDDAIAGKLQDFVDAYNAVRSFMQRQNAIDSETKRSGPLSADPTLRAIERTLRDTVGQLVSFGTNPYSALSDIGVRFDREGRLTFDRDVLTDALEQDALSVRELLAGYGSTDGIATAVARALDPILQTGDGTLATKDSSFDDRLRQLADSISRMEDRVERREQRLIARFTQLERLVSQFQSQSQFIGGFGR